MVMVMDESAPTSEKTVLIPIDLIKISAFNIRKDEAFGDEEDQRLVESIAAHGVLQPIIVRPVGDMYEVSAGRRRLISVKKLGHTEIKCIIKDVQDMEALDISISENVLHKNVDPVSMGRWIKIRLSKGDISLSKYAKKIGKSKSTLSEWLRMNDLTPEMQTEIQVGSIAFRHGLKVARLELPPEKEIALARIARKDGTKAFKNALSTLVSGRENKGAPPERLIVQINWGTESREHSALKHLAASEGILLNEYCQRVLTEHIQSRMGWIARARARVRL